MKLRPVDRGRPTGYWIFIIRDGANGGGAVSENVGPFVDRLKRVGIVEILIHVRHSSSNRDGSSGWCSLTLFLQLWTEASVSRIATSDEVSLYHEIKTQRLS